METKELAKVKNILYEIMTTQTDAGAQTKDITANQQMGVKISNSIKKEGVNIFQLQNVVNTQTITHVVEALKIIDGLQDQKALPIDGTAIQMVIEWLATQQLTLNEFMNGMKKAYIEEVVNQCDTKSEAAKRLDIQRTYLSRILRTLNLTEEDKVDQLIAPEETKTTVVSDEDDVIDAEFKES